MGKSRVAIGLRTLSVVAFLVAIICTTGSESGCLYGRRFTFHYSYWAFSMLFFCANVIACICNFGVIFLPTESRLWPLVVCLDVILNHLLVGAVAATGVGLRIFTSGDVHIGWPAICPSVQYYCNRLVIAVVASCIGLFFCFVLNCYTLGRALNPLLVPKTGGIKKPASSGGGTGGNAGGSGGGGGGNGGKIGGGGGGGSSGGGNGGGDSISGCGCERSGPSGWGGGWGRGFYLGGHPPIMF